MTDVCRKGRGGGRWGKAGGVGGGERGLRKGRGEGRGGTAGRDPPQNRKSTLRILVICPPPKLQICEGEGVWFVCFYTKPHTLTLTPTPFFWRGKNGKMTSRKLLRAGCGTKSRARPRAERGGQGQEGCLSRNCLPDEASSHRSWTDNPSGYQRYVTKLESCE